MRKEKLWRKRIEVRMQQLLCSGDVNFAVLDSKVIAVNQQSRYGQSRNSQSRKSLAVSSAECTWCPMSQMNLWETSISTVDG